jgi:hypothetical protein
MGLASIRWMLRLGRDMGFGLRIYYLRLKIVVLWRWEVESDTGEYLQPSVRRWDCVNRALGGLKVHFTATPKMLSLKNGGCCFEVEVVSVIDEVLVE